MNGGRSALKRTENQFLERETGREIMEGTHITRLHRRLGTPP